MYIKEYRICMPLSVEEVRMGSLKKLPDPNDNSEHHAIDRASAHGRPLKLRLGLISVSAHSPNFCTR